MATTLKKSSRGSTSSKIAKEPEKLAYEMTDEETKEISRAEYKDFFARKKLEREPKKQYIDPEKVDRMLKSLHQPEPRLRSDYDRQIIDDPQV